MTSCIVGKRIRAMGPGPLELFSFVVLAILMAMAGGISEHMLTSWSSLIVLGFNDMSTLVGQSVSSPREREKTGRRGDEKEGWEKEENK